MTLKQTIINGVDRNEIYRYLSAKNKVDDSWQTYVEAVLEETGTLILPNQLMIEDAISVDANQVELIHSDLRLTSENFANHVKGGTRLWLVAATLGHLIERKIKYYFAVNPTRAVIMDACGSALIESYCEVIERSIKAAHTEIKGFTSRFSPGYGDLSLTTQRQLFDRFDIAKRTGIHLSEGDLMLPQKSVVFLIADQSVTPQSIGCQHKCASCTLQHCIYRTEGM
jgi:5-methyltetrahydrofolate--homocysteine methyltransferase